MLESPDGQAIHTSVELGATPAWTPLSRSKPEMILQQVGRDISMNAYECPIDSRPFAFSDVSNKWGWKRDIKWYQLVSLALHRDLMWSWIARWLCRSYVELPGLRRSCGKCRGPTPVCRRRCLQTSLRWLSCHYVRYAIQCYTHILYNI